MRFQPRVLRDQGEGADLAAIADVDVDVDGAAKPDGDIRTDAHAGGFDHAVFNRVTRHVHVGSDHHVVADVQQIGDWQWTNVLMNTRLPMRAPFIRR